MSICLFFQCPLCTVPLKTPKRLPCGHNVCEKCLNNHIIRTVPMSGYDIEEYLKSKDTTVKPKEKHFICPVKSCGKQITPRDPTKRTWLWACQFDNNLGLLSMMEIWRGGFCGSDIPCAVCMISDKPTTSACLHCFCCLCFQCTLVHRHVNPNHHIQRLADLPNHLEIPTVTVGSTNRGEICDNHTRVCKIHPCREVTMFCLDCSRDCCTRCWKSIHGSCKAVDTLVCVNNHLVQTNELKNLDKRFSECQATVSDILVAAIAAKGKELKVGIGFQGLGSKNGIIHGTFSAMYESYVGNSAETKKLNAIIARCELIDACLKTFKSRLNQAIVTAAVDRNTKITFDLKRDCVAMENEVATLTCLTKGMAVPSIDGQIHERNNTITAVASSKVFSIILMKMNGDQADCWLTDCCTTSNGHILVTDYANCKLKWVDETGQLDGLSLQSAPWSICVQDNEGCVTLPSISTIQRFRVDSDAVTLMQQVKTPHRCYGVAVLGVNIVTSLLQENHFMSVSVINPDGVVIQQLSQGEAILPAPAFSKAHYLRAKQAENISKVIISDYRRHTVIELGYTESVGETDSVLYTSNSDGNHGFPAGLAWDDNGDVLVCCNSLGTVRRISTRDHSSTCLLLGLCMPRSVCCFKDDRLLVTVDSGAMVNYVVLFEDVNSKCSDG